MTNLIETIKLYKEAFIVVLIGIVIISIIVILYMNGIISDSEYSITDPSSPLRQALHLTTGV